MRVEKLFHVLVVAGASTTAGAIVVGCGDDSTGKTTGPADNGGTANGGSSNGGSSASGAANGGNGGAADSCEAKCMPSPDSADWTDCAGCCCWLPIGTKAPTGTAPTCGQEPCCVGRGR